ncbi:HTH_48 domain-containing protein [Trichonephila clavipes]|nr:HTH_48 domain-containing protein [Trichonephila clavipes]
MEFLVLVLVSLIGGSIGNHLEKCDIAKCYDLSPVGELRPIRYTPNKEQLEMLCPQNLKLMEIYRKVCEVYRNNVMNESSIRKWCIQFKNGRTNVRDEEKSGRPSIVTDELVAQVDEEIRENHRFTIMELFAYKGRLRCMDHRFDPFLVHV